MKVTKIAKTLTLATVIMGLSACGDSSDSNGGDGDSTKIKTAVYAPIDPNSYTVKAICSGSDLIYTVTGGSNDTVGLSSATNDPRCVTGGVEGVSKIRFTNFTMLDKTNVYTLRGVCDGRNFITVASRVESKAITVSQDSKNCMK